MKGMKDVRKLLLYSENFSCVSQFHLKWFFVVFKDLLFYVCERHSYREGEGEEE